MQQERHIAGVRILVKMIDARGVERGRAPLDAMYGIAEAKQIFGEIGAVLPGNAGKERNAPFRTLNRHVYSNNAPGLAKCSPTTPNRKNNALDRPVYLASIDANRTVQTPITPPFTQANEPKQVVN